jgi:hypothetical protein
VPAEWFALSAGAKIAMDSGTENMDWIAASVIGLARVPASGPPPDQAQRLAKVADPRGLRCHLVCV